MTLLLLSVFLVGLTFSPTALHAQKGISLIRDAEIEATLRAFSNPLFQAAGLSPQAIDIYIVKDKSLNAFVAGGQNLFIHTGLIMRSDNPAQLQGVIAHETGHIAGGHLSRTQDAVTGASATALLGALLGGAAILGGKPDVGAAVIAGGQQAGLRSFLQYSRIQEGAADQAGIKYLESTGHSPRGLLEFFEILEGQELLAQSRQDPYVRSHPLTRDRIDAMRAAIARSPNADKASPADEIERHARMKAKLSAFIESPVITLRRYPESDTSLPARYARAVAYFQRSDWDQSVAELDSLIAERPDDPYFHELKGQVLFEAGRGVEAMPSYQRAADLAPRSPLILGDLARVQIETGDDALLPAAVDNLKRSLDLEPTRAFLWRQLGIAQGRLGNEGASSLALAEEALLSSKANEARYHAERAKGAFPEGSREWLQASDILNALDQADARAKKE
ncbi:MAG: M48 family metalloprotease [Rhodospirillales bacterium]